jgi:hypothetical protein
MIEMSIGSSQVTPSGSFDFSSIQPNKVGNTTLWILALQDKNSSKAWRLIESSQLCNVHLGLLGVGGEQFSEWGFALKLLWLKRFILSGVPQEHDWICVLDAWDLFITGSPHDFIDRLDTYFNDAPIVISAEKNPWPDSQRAEEYPKVASNESRFVNAGALCGRTWALNQALDTQPYQPQTDDQRWWTTAFLDRSNLFHNKMPVIVPDTKNRLFQSMHASENDIEYKNGKSYNKLTKTWPLTLHFNGSKLHMNTHFEKWRTNFIL